MNFFTATLPPNELKADYWNELGASDLNKALNKFENLNTNVAKNVILFVGDGMSLGTMVAGRILKGQRGNDGSVDDVQGEETVTAIDELPHVGILKTYSSKLIRCLQF